MKRRKWEEGEGKGGVKYKRWRLKKGARKKRKKKSMAGEGGSMEEMGFGERPLHKGIKTREK